MELQYSNFEEYQTSKEANISTFESEKPEKRIVAIIKMVALDKNLKDEEKESMDMNEKLYLKSTRSDIEDEFLETKLQRYSLSKLYALRNIENSQKPPELRAELQNLGFWKYNTNNSQTAGSSENAIGAESDNLGNRPQRQPNLRERSFIFARSSGGNRADGILSISNPVPKTSFMDQRSNSIAHLMPAFAKKRIVAEAAATQQNNGGIGANCEEDERFRNSSRLDHPNVNTNCPKSVATFPATIRSTSPHRRSMGRHIGNEIDDILSTSSPNARHERRIGSGRLLHREVGWDYHEKNSTVLQKHTANNSRFPERSNVPSTPPRGFERRNHAGGGELSNTHSTMRRQKTVTPDEQRPQRRSYNDRNDEPEWFSGGPTSQNDTIELRGFDEPIESSDNGDSKESRRNYELEHHNISSSNTSEQVEQQKIESSSNIKTSTKSEKEQSEKATESNVPKPVSKEFNFDAFLNLDPLDPDFMRSDVCNQTDLLPVGGSRFKRWFASKDKIDEPVHNTAQRHGPETQRPANNILEFIQQAKTPNHLEHGAPQRLDMPSVEELEARMRKIDVNEKARDEAGEHTQQKLQPAAQDMEAFKKLLEQLNNANNSEVNQDHLHLNCMPSKPRTAQNLPMMPPPHHLGPFPAAPLPPTQLMSITPVAAQQPPQPILANLDEMKRVSQLHHQQAQQQQFPFINPHASLPSPLVGGEAEQKHREFVNLFHAVNRGQVPLAFLEKELSNPNIPAQTRDIISAVIREITRSMTPSLAQLPTPVQLMRTSSPLHQQQQQQQGMHSPVAMMNVIAHPQPNRSMIPGGVPPLPGPPPIGISGPNPQELHIRNQAIIQNAMLKKKIEEQQQQQTQQQEALNRCSEVQKAQEEANNHTPHYQAQSQANVSTGTQNRSMSSPSPLAFTPTSVLRKMTADKDSILGTQQHQQQKATTQMINKTFHQQQQQQHKLVNSLTQQPLPRMILGGGGNNATPQQSQHGNAPSSPQAVPLLQQRMTPNDLKWQTMMLNQSGGTGLGVYGNIAPPLTMPTSQQKPMGRPILKGPPPLSPMSQQQTHVPSMVFSPTNKIDQQRLKNNQTPQHMFNQNPTQLSQGFATSGPGPAHLLQPTAANNLTQNMLHMQHQQTASPQLFHQMHQMSLQQQQQMQLQRQLHQQHHPQQRDHTTNQTAGNLTANNANSDNMHSSINSSGQLTANSRDGGLSPTSNQLAQWFSPELLAQASAGKLPQINVNQALSLEEFERNIQQHSSTVHN